MPPPYPSQYAFQLCSSHNWDGITRLHDEIIATVNDALCKPREKTDIKMNLKYLLRVTDDWGNTPLHIACFHRAPPNTISSLLNLADIAGLGSDTNAKGSTLSHEVVTAQLTDDGSSP
jgi:hypothetical protein